MSEDDDLRDGFGAQITAALERRSRGDIPTARIALPRRPAHHRRARRRVLVGALAIALLATAVGILLGRDHEKGFVRTIHPAATTTDEKPRTTATSTGPPTTTSRVNAGPRNLAISQSVHDALVATFATHQGFPLSYVGGEVPGSVYYAYDPGTGTYWALASYTPSAEASRAHDRLAAGSANDPLIGFQDGPFKFSRAEGAAWRLVGDTGGLICPPPPESVLAVWALGGNNDCP